jgi:hypothetical protein
MGAAFREAAPELGLDEFTMPMLVGALAMEGIVALSRDVGMPNRRRVRRCIDGYAAVYLGSGPERQARREAIFHRIRVDLLGEREH